MTNINAKLTKPQQQFLLDAAGKRGTSAIQTYKPLVTCLRLGFVDNGRGGKEPNMGFGHGTWFITENGRAWLRAKGLLPAVPPAPESEVRLKEEREPLTDITGCDV